MKKSVLTILMILLLAAASMAQIRVGGFLGYGSGVDRWGLGANGEFMFNDRMALSPSILFYFPETISGLKYSYWELNGNFHYYFLRQDVVNVYGLAGLNLTTAKVRRDAGFLDSSTSRTNTEAGLNLGLGTHLDLGPVMPFAELKYVAGNVDQMVLWLGLKVPLRD